MFLEYEVIVRFCSCHAASPGCAMGSWGFDREPWAVVSVPVGAVRLRCGFREAVRY